MIRTNGLEQTTRDVVFGFVRGAYTESSVPDDIVIVCRDYFEGFEDDIEQVSLKNAALAQRTTIENFELREMVNELRDENFHLRREIYELQDKINRQVLQINKLEKSQAASNQADLDR